MGMSFQMVVKVLYFKNSRMPQSGSAMVEFFVLLLAMVPVLFMIPTIGKMIDLKQTTHQASRYIAWQNAKSPSNISSGELVNRFYTDPGSPITTLGGNETDNPSSNPGGTAENPLWGQQRSHDPSRVAARLDTVSYRNNDGSLPELSRGISRGIERTASVLNFLGNVDWDLPSDAVSSDGITVSASISRVLNPVSSNCSPDTDGAAGDEQATNGENQQVCFSDSNAILTDSWSSGSDSQARERTRAFVPAAVLDRVGDGLAVLGRVTIVKELRGLRNAFGHIDSDQLPLDRYPEP